MRKTLLLLACAWPILAAATAHAAKEAEGPSAPVLQADRLSYDENANIVTATGHVEVAMDDQILRADKIVFNKETNVVRATGNVALTQASGEVIRAKTLEMTSDMADGFIDGVGILFPDQSRLAANDAQRYEGRWLVADHGVYSACSLCADDPQKPPLWQVKGVRVTHDGEEQTVSYRDATIEFAGTPLFYTPYLSHPDPTVRRKQGFLTPMPGHSSSIGYMTQFPYYYDLAPNSDLVVMPTFSQKDKVQLAGDWRHRFSNGSMRWSGSFTKADFVNEDGFDRGQQWRGNLFGMTRFDLSDTWRAGTDVAFTSDKSYLLRYKISAEDVLVNRAYAERFSGRNYAVGNMYYFQDTRPGAQLKEPFVAPELRYSAFGEPNQTLGGRWSFNSGLLVTARDKDVPVTQQGANTRRLALDAGWERQMASSTGFLTTISGLARADTYWADNVPDPNEPLGTGFSSVSRVRPFAQGDVSVRYPLGRRGDGYQQILEPITVLSVAPRQLKNMVLPNEDSLDVELDDTNIFSSNRFTGIDRLEGGTRVAYGMRHTLIGDGGEKIEMLGGQVFRTEKDPNFPDGSGLEDKKSDYVGRVGFSPATWLNANYGFRLAQDDFGFTRQQVSVTGGAPVFQPSLRYLSSNQINATTDLVEKLEEGSVGFSSAFTKFWALHAAYNHAFQPTPGPRKTTVSVVYKDECFEASLSGERDYTSRVGLDTGTTVMFRFFLKNIGGWETSKMSTGK